MAKAKKSKSKNKKKTATAAKPQTKKVAAANAAVTQKANLGNIFTAVVTLAKSTQTLAQVLATVEQNQIKILKTLGIKAANKTSPPTETQADETPGMTDLFGDTANGNGDTTVTKEELNTILQEGVAKHGLNTVHALILKNYNVNKVSDLAPSSYSKVIADVQAL